MAVKEVWSDLHHKLETDARGSIRKVINIDAVITSIDNILRTIPGERVMLPSFGAGLTDLVFESARQEEFDIYARTIREAITTWDDRVIINSIKFFAKPDSNAIIVKMSFSIRNYDRIFEHSVELTGV